MVVFGIPGTVNVQYEAVQSVIMDANPVPGNELNACTSVTNGVIMDIFSTGSLFSALRANSFLLFEDQVPVLRPVCGSSLRSRAYSHFSSAVCHRRIGPFAASFSPGEVIAGQKGRRRLSCPRRNSVNSNKLSSGGMIERCNLVQAQEQGDMLLCALASDYFGDGS